MNKKFIVNGDQTLRFSLSNDGVTFSSEQTLFNNFSAQDQYIVAVGFVTKGNQILGGASAVDTLDQNRIFVRWLQKKTAITDSSGAQYLVQGAYGPDRQWFTVPQTTTGTVLVYAEDGVTPLAAGAVDVIAGKAYQLVLVGG